MSRARLTGIKPTLAVLALALPACKERDAAWDTPFHVSQTVGLEGSVAVVDKDRDELLMLVSPEKNLLETRRIHIGRDIVQAVPSRDRDLLLVLSRGVFPRLSASDERPLLSVVSGGPNPELLTQYELDDPLQKLALDPEGEWAVAYGAEGAVVNVNELILIHLAEPAEAPIPITIQSSGGSPQRFTFTAKLRIPGAGSRRLLVVETDQNLSLIDLEAPTAKETFVPLPSTRSGGLARPAQVVFHDDVAGDDEIAAYLAVRLANDSNVLTLRLSEPRPGSTTAYSLVNNIVDAAGQPSTIDFVETDSGLRLAALVPSLKRAVLFDPATSKSELVEFEQPYSGIARITGLVSDQPAVGDVALLYSESTPSIAFWRLAEASSTPYASFDAYTVENRVSQVLDVPGTDFAHLKLLTGQGSNEFFLLDLESRETHPMLAQGNFNLRLAPDGRRAWAFASGGNALAQLDFADKHPISVAVERPLYDLFDIARGSPGSRTLIALHSGGSKQEPSYGSDLGATLFDATEPNSADTRFYSGLILEGWQ